MRIYVSKYLEDNGVDTTGLTPEAVTAFVLSYQEVEGGALTTALTPDDVTAMVVKYLEAEGVDVSALTPDQVEALVSSFVEATGCDKSALAQSLTGYISQNCLSPPVRDTLASWHHEAGKVIYINECCTSMVEV